MDIKAWISRYALPLAWTTGAIVFLLGFALASSANWSAVASFGVAVLLFIGGVAGVYIVASNIIDARTRDIVQNKQDIDRRLAIVTRQVESIHDADIVQRVMRISSHLEDLVALTEQSEPVAMATVVSTLNKWLEILERTVNQYVSMQDSPQYYENAARRQEAGEAFEAFDQFLLQSIRALKRGDEIDFDASLHMLESTRINNL